MQRFRARRRRQAELALADARHHLDLWGYHPGTSPGKLDAMKRDVEECRKKLLAIEKP